MSIAPFGRLERLLAWRYVASRRREGFISFIAVMSFLGIALGVATLIVVMAVMNGFQSQIFAKTLGVNGHVAVYASRSLEARLLADAPTLGAAVDARLVAPYAERQALLSTPAASRGALVRGMRPADFARLPFAQDDPSLDLAGGLLLGSRLAESLGAAAGSRITLLSPRGAETPFGVTPRARAFALQGTFSAGMAQIDAGLAFMPLAQAAQFFTPEAPLGANVVEIFLDDPSLAPAAAQRIRSRFPQYAARDWTEIHAALASALAVERNVMFLILTLIIIVAAFNVASGMVMLVRDKGREIAILRAMGAGAGSPARVFFMAGSLIGVVGALAGFGLGVLLCANIESVRQGLAWITGTDLFSPEVYFLYELPAEMDPMQTLIALGVALALSMVATVYPAWRAGRVAPSLALRGA